MFIAIEGTDASGKSMLCAELRKQLSAQMSYHKGRPERETREWVLNEYVLDVNKLNFAVINAVADRWHWGEVTYAPLKRPHTCIDNYGLLGLAGWRWVEMFMAARGMCQFWLHQPIDIIKQRLNKRGDTFVVDSELETILDLYENAATYTHTLCGHLTPPSDELSSIQEFAKHVIALASAATQQVAHLQPYLTYIGAIEPRYLIITNEPETDLPLMPMFNSLNEKFIANVPEHIWRHIGIVNASNMTAEQLYTLVQVLKFPTVVPYNDSVGAMPALFDIPKDMISNISLFLF